MAYYSNSNGYSVVSGSSESDTIYNNAYAASINAGDGDDRITNYGSRAVINAEADNDTVYNSGDYSNIDLGEGNDSIYSADEDYSTIKGGNGDDTISGHYWQASIAGGAGADRISLGSGGGANAVNGGTGDDEIYLDTINGGNVVIEYSTGDGDDTIYGFRSNSMLKINGTVDAVTAVSVDGGDGTVSYTDLLLAVGENTITLKDAANVQVFNITDSNGKVSVPGEVDFEVRNYTSGNDYVTVYGKRIKVNTFEGNDTVYATSNSNSSNYIDTGADNDIIYNNGSTTTIDSGEGNDYISTCSNTTGNVIESGAGDDTVYANGIDTTVRGGDGNDLIVTSSTKNEVYGGDGNDTIRTNGPNSSVSAGLGDDFIENYSGEALINGDDGNDHINNYGKTSTLVGGAGDDTILNSFEGISTDEEKVVLIEGGTGNDSIRNDAQAVSINAGEGGNTIDIYGENNTVKVAEGNDTIYLQEDVTSITVEEFGVGDAIVLAEEVDSINTETPGVVIAGGVTINGLNETTTIKGWFLNEGVASFIEDTNSSVVLSDDGRTIVYGRGASVDRKTLIEVSGVTSTDGLIIDTENKTIIVSSSSLGEETVSISYENLEENYNDYILALGEDVSQSSEVETEGWQFNEETDEETGEQTTSATYIGNGKTAGYAIEDNKIYYSSEEAGKTFVTVEGVVSTDGLVIDKDNKVVTVSTASLSENSTVTVSEGYTLALGEDVDKWGEKSVENGWHFSENTASYVNGTTSYGYLINEEGQIVYESTRTDDALVTVEGVISTDGLAIDTENKVVTVSAASLSEDLTVKISDGYTLALGEDVDPFGEKSTEIGWELNDTTASYVSKTTSYGYLIDEDGQIVNQTTSVDDTLVTVEGVTSTDGLAIDTENKVVTISAASLSQDLTVKISDGYTLALGEDVTPYTVTDDSTWVLEGDSASYVTGSTEYGYKLSDDATEIAYASIVESNKIVTVTGVTSIDGLTIDETNKVVTVSKASLGESDVTVSEGYTLALEGDLDPVKEFSGWTHRGSEATGFYVYGDIRVTQAGYTLSEDSTSIIYTPLDETESVSIYNVTSGETQEFDADEHLVLDIATKTVTVHSAALYNVEDPVRITDGFKFALASDVVKPSGLKEEFIDNTGNHEVFYAGRELTGGHDLSGDNRIIYTASETAPAVTIAGMAAGASAIITRKGKKFIIPQAAIAKDVDDYEDGEIAVSVYSDQVEGYGFKLDDTVQKPTKTTKTGWESVEGASGTYRYNTGEITSGFVLNTKDYDNDQVLFKGEVANTVLAEVTGIKSSKGLAINKDSKVITVYKEALNGEDIMLNPVGDEESTEYIFALGDEVSPSSGGNEWVFNSQSGISEYHDSGWVKEGYEIEAFGDDANRKINHIAEQQGGISVALKGVAGNLDFKSYVDDEGDNAYDEKTVQLNMSTFQDNVEVLSNAGELGFDIAAGEYNEATFIGHSSIKNVVTNNGNDVIFGLGGLNDEFQNIGEGVSVNGGAGKDKINNEGTSVTIEGGTGNDNITVSGGASGNMLVYSSGDGKDKIFNFTQRDTLKIGGNETPYILDNVQGNNVVFDIGNGSITLKDGAISDARIRIVDASGNAIESISGNTYTTKGVIRDEKIRLATNFRDNWSEYVATASVNSSQHTVSIVDGSQLEEGISINAGLEGTSILGGVGKDTLISGDQDFSFRGGNGNDVFVYNGGFNGRIEDYSISGKTGKDRVSIDWDNFKEYDITTENLILTFNDEKTLIIDGVKNTNVTFLIPGTTKTKVSSFNDDAIFSSKGKLAEVGYNPNAKRNNATFDGTQNSKTVTIDASNANYEINLVGNKKANSIVAGQANSTINGGRGKDTLVGGAGSDIFIYEKNSGNKVIRNYEYSASGGDVISLQSGVKITDISDKEDGNRILSVGKDKITLEGGASLEAIKFDDSTEKIAKESMLMTLVDGKETSVSLTSGFSATDSINISETGNYSDKDWLNLDASDRKKGLSITGDTQANSLIGSKGNDIIQGGDGDDFINGGAGNDELWGDDGADTFTFYVGNGTDTIGDFGGDDMIRILDTNGRAVNFKGKYNSSKDILTLSVNGGGKVLITGLADRLEDGQSVEDLTLNINGSHKISGKKLK